jgi:tetraacyldisaccharide 4'-kinase
MQRVLEALWYRRNEGPLARLLLSPLWLLSLLYGAVVARRRARIARRGGARKVSARVVSVGNLTVGGAGKTPVAIEVARRLQERGEQPAVLSRGYGREGSAPLVVSDGKSLLGNPKIAGDEPLVIARALPQVPVLVGPDRAALAELAITRLGARSLVLDDGFQHLKLARDLDIVVIDASNPYGNGYLLPRGPMREPRSALRRAGLVWLSKCDQADAATLEALAREAQEATGRPPVRSAYRITDVAELGGKSLDADALRGKKVGLLAGLARPESFVRTVEAAGATIASRAFFRDHHCFTGDELRQAARAARRHGAEAIATTAKDAARLPGAHLDLPLLVVHVQSCILSGEEQLTSVL